MVVGDRGACSSRVNEEHEHASTSGNPVNAYSCVSYHPVRVPERCARQRTSGVDGMRRYVHEF
jgi:hypothetical protein